MLHAGLSTGINWHNQDAVAVGKIAQVMSLILLFLSINHSLLHIAQASARSKQLKYYKGNWVTVEIMKMLLKNRHSYQKHIGHLDVDEEDPTSKDIDRQDNDDWEEMYVKSKTDNNKGDEDENGYGGGNKYKDGNSGGVSGDTLFHLTSLTPLTSAPTFPSTPSPTSLCTADSLDNLSQYNSDTSTIFAS